jgi:acetyl-CoA C-acetyltransferase
MPIRDVVILGAQRTPIGKYGGMFRDVHPAELGAVASRAAFGEGIITAGSSSGITDGGAALVLTASDVARARGLKPRAKLLGWASAGVDPRIMGIGPVPGLQKLTRRIGLGPDDFDLVELNEAFAPQVLA